MNCNYTHNLSSEIRFFDSTFDIDSDHLKKKDYDLIIPDCTPGILWVKEGKFVRKHKTGFDEFRKGDIILFGQKTSSVIYEMEDVHVDAVGFKLMPYSINYLFGISAHTITDKTVLLRNQEHRDRIKNLLLGTSPFIPKDQITTHLEIVAKLTCEFNQSKGITPIKELIDSKKYNYKYIERIFKKHVGITPKLYCRIIRFNHAFRLLNTNFNLTDIAYQCGYFDQNHFIKEIKHFTGYTPKFLFNFSQSNLEKNHIDYINKRSF